MAYRRTKLSITQGLRRRVKWDITGSVCQRCERFNPDTDLPMVVDWEGLTEHSPQPGEEGMLPGSTARDQAWGVVKDSTATWCEVMVKHHGAEEVKRFEFESRTWGWGDLRQMLKLVRWFDPVDEEEQGRLVVPVGIQLVRARR